MIFKILCFILIPTLCFSQSINKIDNNNFTVTKTVVSRPISITQLKSRISQWTKQISDLQTQIDQANAMISQAQQAGVVEVATVKPVKVHN